MSFKFNPFTGTMDIVNNKLSSTPYTGLDCTGLSGDTDRTLTTSGVTLLVVDNQFLHPIVGYTVVANVITFLNEVWDSQKITVWN